MDERGSILQTCPCPAFMHLVRHFQQVLTRMCPAKKKLPSNDVSFIKSINCRRRKKEEKKGSERA